MHELSMANSIVETVLEEAKKRNASSVIEVAVVVGEFSMLGLEQLRFSYRVLTEDTPLANSKLRIKREDGKVRCGGCGFEGPIQFKQKQEYHLVFPTLECPRCGEAVEMVAGRGCYVKSIKLRARESSPNP